jgi:hypothetical protein
MWIHVGRATIKYNLNLDIGNQIQPKFGLWKIFIAGFFQYFAFISIRKEAIKIIQMDSRSRNDAPSSGKNFLFRKLITCQHPFVDVGM